MARLGNVLQVNVRLSEGGAAGVARMLSDELRDRGIESPVAYGYSKLGRASPFEDQYQGVRITPALLAAANRTAFYLVGEETPLRFPGRWGDYENAVSRADVVHFHAVHSHVARVRDLARVVARAGKPLVWTMHDQWHFTGRCAQPGSCRLWEHGCRKCPDLRAYPPTLFDNARDNWPIRRELLRTLASTVPFALVACAEWLGMEARIAGLPNVSVVTNAVDSEFWNAAYDTPLDRSSPRLAGQPVRCLFVCRDLRDRNKVDWDVLRQISALPNTSLTIVGDNAPIHIPGAHMRPATSSRSEMASVMRSHDALIFLSKVDYFPLTLAEALTAGITVYAIDSRASRELKDAPGMNVFESGGDIVLALSSAHAATPTAAVVKEYRERFNPAVMADGYVALYQRLLGEDQ